MKMKTIPCHTIRYKEFPELLFGESPDSGLVYFDATHFIRSRGDEGKHNLQEFRLSFHHWIVAFSEAYKIETGDIIVQDALSGHMLIDECLALLFVVYIDSSFGVYSFERISELLINGFAVSDTWLVNAAGNRFTSEELTTILKSNET